MTPEASKPPKSGDVASGSSLPLQPGTSYDEIKKKLECDKMTVELAELGKPWYVRPSALLAVMSSLLAGIGVVGQCEKSAVKEAAIAKREAEFALKQAEERLVKANAQEADAAKAVAALNENVTALSTEKKKLQEANDAMVAQVKELQEKLTAFSNTLTDAEVPQNFRANVDNVQKGLRQLATQSAQSRPKPDYTDVLSQDLDELQLKRWGEDAFDDGDYEAAAKLFEKAKSVERSGVWQSAYPLLAASKVMLGDRRGAESALNELRSRLELRRGYLSHETPLRMLVKSIEKSIAVVPEDDKIAFNQMRTFVESHGQTVPRN